MEMNEELIRKVAQAVLKQMQNGGNAASDPKEGRTRMAPKRDYSGYPLAKKGTDPKEVVIGVGPAFQREIKATICGLDLKDVIRNVKAGIEEEG